jgi:Sugar phosphate isomerases/epimerases
MRIGFAATYGFSSIYDVIEFAKKNEFNAVEINLNIPEFFPERYGSSDILKLKRLSTEYGIAYTFHGPEDINLCSKQKYIVDVSLKRLKECIEFAYALGGQRFTFHIGDSVNFTMYDGSLRMEDYYQDEYTKIIYDSLSELISYSSGKILICAENTGYFSYSKTEAIKSLLGKGLFLTWDIGHSFIKTNQREFMEEHIDYVRNVHIHDVQGTKDHCIIGTGEVDIKGHISKLLCGDRIYIIEVRPAEAAVKSYNNLKLLLGEK